MLSLLLPALASGAGITPYLPIDLPATQGRQVSLLLALADEPLLRRPISLATIDAAMERACPRDPALCEEMEQWLVRYRSPLAVTALGAELGLSDNTRVPQPNRRGLQSDDAWWVGASGQWQPSKYLILAAGASARSGEVLPTGTVLSVGGELARLDVGFEDRWLSPHPDSALLQSTQAATMASLSLSNERPITRARLRYELQVSRMSWSGRIADQGVLTSGHPLLAGMHVSMQPAPGWSLGVARQLQFGGGSRDARVQSLLKAFFAPNHYDNFRTGRPEEFGNQQAAWSSSFVYPGATPFIVSMEFAGEDTSHGTPGRLGNSAVSLGVEAPRVWRNLGLRYQISEWQNAWYTHHIYADGLTNRQQVIGHWGASWRAPGDDVGARSQSLVLQWSLAGGRSLDVQWRTLQNQSYSPVPYRRAFEFGLSYAAPLGRAHAGTELLLGRDVFGERYYRLAAFARLRQAGDGLGQPAVASGDESASMFIDVGAALSRVRVSRDVPGVPTQTSALQLEPHLGLGLRRAVWNRSDLGVRLELDQVEGRALVALRALDYRFRVGRSLAVTAFLGAARLDLQTPAYGYYAGGGLQWRDARPRWDINLDVRYGDKIARDELDPGSGRPSNNDVFHDLFSTSLSLSRRFQGW